MEFKPCVDITKNAGFTLMEVMIATVVLSIGILSLYTMQLTAIRANATAYKLTASSNAASDRIEKLLSLDYNDPLLADKDKDGTNHDLNNDGIDDDGAGLDFGLNDADQATADGRDPSPPAGYTIVWNVAVDYPVPNSKTIRVLVTRQTGGITKTVPMTYIKADEI